MRARCALLCPALNSLDMGTKDTGNKRPNQGAGWVLKVLSCAGASSHFRGPVETQCLISVTWTFSQPSPWFPALPLPQRANFRASLRSSIHPFMCSLSTYYVPGPVLVLGIQQ